MTLLARDRLAGVLLLLVAVVWIALVYGTFAEDLAGGPTTSRTFPLASGALLALLSLLLIAGTFVKGRHGTKGRVRIDALEWRGIVATFGFLAAYVSLLYAVGFILGTIAAIVAFLYLMLGKRSPWLLIGYSFGFAFGVWFILGEMMAVYLPRGALINLF